MFEADPVKVFRPFGKTRDSHLLGMVSGYALISSMPPLAKLLLTAGGVNAVF